MAETGSAARSLMLVLHDIAPETWPDYQPFVEAVDKIGGVPMTWLVVPKTDIREAAPRQGGDPRQRK